MNKKSKNRIGYALLWSFFIFLIIRWYIEAREDELLKKYFKSTAVITEIHKPEVIHDSYSGTFQYKIKNKTYEFTQIGNYTLLKLGDTVEIKYAMGDYSIARVTEKYYMEKYRRLKNNNE